MALSVKLSQVQYVWWFVTEVMFTWSYTTNAKHQYIKIRLKLFWLYKTTCYGQLY